jgi:hypothetical protein
MASVFEHACRHLLLSLTIAEANPLFWRFVDSGKALANILIEFSEDSFEGAQK